MYNKFFVAKDVSDGARAGDSCGSLTFDLDSFVVAARGARIDVLAA